MKQDAHPQSLSLRDLEARLDQVFPPLNSAGFDPWGMDPKTLKSFLPIGLWFYQNYFRVQVFGADHVPSGRVMIVANHSGQLPFDALMLAMALIKDLDPPRIPRSMVDYWVPSLPFISGLFNRFGAVVGSPLNCIDLLQAEQCVMVFPEGTRGLGKPFSQRYQLQNFGTGFLRLALEAKAPIVPVSIVGAEEIYPFALNIKPLAHLLGTPYFPITPQMALLGPLAALPLPCRMTMRFAPPLYFEADPDIPDGDLSPLIEQVKKSLNDATKMSLKERGWDVFGLGRSKKPGPKAAAKGDPK